MVRSLVTLAVLVAGLAAFPAAASAYTCAYDPEALTYTFAMDQGDYAVGASLTRAGTEVQFLITTYDNEMPRPAECSGGPATIYNTDTIVFRDSERETWPEHEPHTRTLFEIDLRNGSLKPGFTPEDSGTSEIELELDMGEGVDHLTVNGSSRVHLGTAAATEETRLNLNAAELVEDADIVATGLDGSVGVIGDWVDGRGSPATGGALATYLSASGSRLYAGSGGSSLRGGALDDILVGGDGDDTLFVGDSRWATDGADTLTGGDGSDAVSFARYGLAGITVDLGKSGAQQMGTGPKTLSGIERAVGSPGPDRIYGSDGPNELKGMAGVDILAGRGGADKLDGGSKDPNAWGSGVERDVADYGDAAGPVTADLGPAPGQVTGAAGDDLLTNIEEVKGSSHGDTLTGGSGADRLFGGPGADRLSGLGGQDFLEPGSSASGGPEGADTIDGGPDADTISYAGRTGPVAVLMDGSRNDGHDANRNGVSSSSEEADRSLNVENALGGNGPDRLKAIGTAVNHLDGGPGDDRLDGGLGSDTLEGWTGTDTVSYAGRSGAVAVRLDGLRNDGADPNGDGVSAPSEEYDQTLHVENATGGDGADRLAAIGTVNNVLTGGPGHDRLDGGPGTDRLDGGAGSDTIAYAGRAGGVAIRLDGARNDGADPNGDGTSLVAEEGDRDLSIENASGGDGPDKLFAFGAGVNVLTGGAGADLLDARDGSTTVDVLDCGTQTDQQRSDPSDTKNGCETALP